jgi:hypothetical protein
LFVCLLLLFRLLLLSSSRVCSCLKLGATKKRRKGREQNHEQRDEYAQMVINDFPLYFVRINHSNIIL